MRRSVRLNRGVFVEATFTAPWSVVARIGREECLPFPADLVQLIGDRVVLEERMLVGIDGEPPA